MNPNILAISNKKVTYVSNKISENRPYLVFLHDSLGCIELWRDFPELLAIQTNCNLLIYDRLGYGKSDTFLTEKRELNYMELEADFLNVFLEKLNIKEAILFGHSDGGSIALIAAAKYPEKIKGVVSEGAHIFVEEITLQGIREAKMLFQNSNLPEKLAKYHGTKTQALFDAWTETWLRPDFFAWNIEHFLPKIHCPVLVIQGIDDEFGSSKQVEGIVNGIRHINKKSYLIEGAKHTPHKEAKEMTLRISSEFISHL